MPTVGTRTPCTPSDATASKAGMSVTFATTCVIFPNVRSRTVPPWVRFYRAIILLCYFNSCMNVNTSNISLSVSLVATFALFRLRIQASTAFAATPFIDAITAQCGACSKSIFFCRHCLFAYRYCLWLLVARIANSSPHPLLRNKHPAAILAFITFLDDGLLGLVIFAKLTGTN